MLTYSRGKPIQGERRYSGCNMSSRHRSNEFRTDFHNREGTINLVQIWKDCGRDLSRRAPIGYIGHHIMDKKKRLSSSTPGGQLQSVIYLLPHTADPTVGMGNALKNPRSPRTVAVLVTELHMVWLRRCRPRPVAAVAAAKLRPGCRPRGYLCCRGSRPKMVLVCPSLDCQIAPLAPPPPRAPLPDRSSFVCSCCRYTRTAGLFVNVRRVLLLEIARATVSNQTPKLFRYQTRISVFLSAYCLQSAERTDIGR